MRGTLTALVLALATPAVAEPLQVVTDIPAVHSLVSRLAGDRAEVALLADRATDLHHMQLRPSQGRSLAQADLIVWMGEDLTPWLERARQSLAPETPSLALFTFLEENEEPDDDHGHDDHEGEHHNDPHVWLDPVAMAASVAPITARLIALDPDGADAFRTAQAETEEMLAALEKETKAVLEPVSDRAFIVSHDGFDYFADRFGLTIAGSITDVAANAASAGTLSDLTSAVDQQTVTCVFGEVGHDSRLAHLLSDHGAKLGGDLDPGGLTLAPGPELYPQLIRNLSYTLVDCLSD
jgi:zinc transport system substrate-binding protein